MTIIPTTPNIETDTDKTYKVTANVYSNQIVTYNETVNTTAIFGPIGFDWYEVVTSATSTNFTNDVSFNHSEGLNIPSWVFFNPSTPLVLVSNTSEASVNTYSVTNGYTGVFENITFTTNFTINITEVSTAENKNDDYCLNASSKAVCGIYIGLICFAIIALVVFILVLLYCKLKKPNRDMSQVNQVDANESHCINEEFRPTTQAQQNLSPIENDERTFKITIVEGNQV